jgi:hypothetical protein
MKMSRNSFQFSARCLAASGVGGMPIHHLDARGGARTGAAMLVGAPIDRDVAGPAAARKHGRVMPRWVKVAVLVASVFTAVAALGSSASWAQDRGHCGSLPGVWKWFSGNNAYFYPGGHLRGGGFTGSWACTRGEVVIVWSHGHTDRVTISPSGIHLSGVNESGTPIWGRRIGGL